MAALARIRLVGGGVLASSAGGPVGATMIAYPDGLSTYWLSALRVSEAVVGEPLTAMLAVQGNNALSAEIPLSGAVSGVVTRNGGQGDAIVFARFDSATWSVTAGSTEPLSLTLQEPLPSSVAGLVLTCWVGPQEAISSIPTGDNLLAIQGLPDLLKWATNPVVAPTTGGGGSTGGSAGGGAGGGAGSSSVLHLSPEEILVGSLGLGVVAGGTALAVVRARRRGK